MRDKLQRIALAIVGLLFIVFVYFLYDTLRPRTLDEQLAQIIHQEDRRRQSDQLVQFVTDPSPQLRQRAALAIGRIGAEGSAPLLMDMLADSSLDVAATAAFAVGLTGERNMAEPLLDLAWELPATVTAQAVQSAGRLADSSMTSVIAGLAAFLTHPSPEVRESTCYALYYAGARSKAAELTLFTAGEPDRAVLTAALWTLARFGADEATPVFKRFLADSDPYVRSLAVRGMGRSTSSDATSLLAMALNDRDLNVVSQAVSALAGRSDDATVPIRLAEKLASESDEKLTVQLIGALERLQSDRGVAAVYALLGEGDQLSDNILAASLTYLATVQKDRAVALVDSVLSGPQPARVRAAAVRAYALTENTGVISRLGERFGDEDPLVRAAAYEGLVRLDSNNIDFYIRKALDDADPVLGVYALGSIREGRRAEYLPVIHTIMSRGEAIDVDLRRSILETIEPFLQKSGNDSTVMEILIQGALDRNYVVRRQAAEIYRDKFDEDRSRMVAPAETTIDPDEIAKAFKRYAINPHAVLLTQKGEIDFELRFDLAPLTVINFIKLAREGFYDGLIFHRVVPDFVVQGGDPRGDGWGGPAHYIRCEYSKQPYERGTVGIATSGKDTGGSQFFITLSPQPHLNGRYTVFGQVVEGMEAVDQIVVGDVIEKVLITEAEE